MKEGPNIALIGSLIGDPARANMLTALMSGKALTATELAHEAGVTVQTASSHLKKLVDGGMLNQRKSGRHRYFSTADDEVADLLESLMGLAAKQGHMRTRTGPKDPALRKARVCYNHLAGEVGVALFDSLQSHGHIRIEDEHPLLTDDGAKFFSGFGIDLEPLKKARRPVCKSCLDWSARRSHLAGGLGVALLNRFYELSWAKRLDGTRIVEFSRKGEMEFAGIFGS